MSPTGRSATGSGSVFVWAEINRKEGVRWVVLEMVECPTPKYRLRLPAV
ncbi:hypothetical protein Hanom_Chr00s002487g01700711 [Helianthus anomalus]